MISLFIALAGASAIASAIIFDDTSEGERLLKALDKLSLYGLDEIKLVESKLSFSKFISNTNSWIHAEVTGNGLLDKVENALAYIRANAKAWIAQEGYAIEQEIKSVLAEK